MIEPTNPPFHSERRARSPGKAVATPALRPYSPLAFVLVAAIAVVAHAAPPEAKPEGPPAVEKDVVDVDAAALERLVRELGAEDFETREAAQRRLLEIGPPAESAVRAVADSADAEQRIRARAILDEFRKEVKWAPSRVTLRVENMPTIEALTAVSKETDNAINLARSSAPPDVKVTANFEGRPYWEVVDELARQGRVAIRFYDDPFQAGLVVAPGLTRSPPTSYEGPFRLRLVNFNRSLSVSADFVDDEKDRQDALQLGFDLTWEPKFKLCRYAGWPRVIEAISDTGENLARPIRSKNALMHIYRRTRSVSFTASLKSPEKPIREIKKIRVDLDLAAAMEYETLALESMTVGQSDRRAGYELELIAFKESEERFEMMIDWSRPRPFDRINAIDLVDEHLEITDEKGKPLPVSLHRVVGDRMGVRFSVWSPRGAGRPTKLRYHVAPRPVRQTVGFTFGPIAIPPLGP